MHIRNIVKTSSIIDVELSPFLLSLVAVAQPTNHREGLLAVLHFLYSYRLQASINTWYGEPFLVLDDASLWTSKDIINRSMVGTGKCLFTVGIIHTLQDTGGIVLF